MRERLFFKDQAIESSNLESFTYDSDDENLIIKFKEGGEYKYKKVLPVVVEEFFKSESKGKFFHASIKGKYEFEKIAKVEKEQDTLPFLEKLMAKFKVLNPNEKKDPLLWALEVGEDPAYTKSAFLKLALDCEIPSCDHTKITTEAVYDFAIDSRTGVNTLWAYIHPRFDNVTETKKGE